MSNYLINRVAKIIISTEGDTIEVKDLRIEFDIEKTSESDPNKGTMIIFNLNETHRAALENEVVYIELEVGYEEGDTTVLFKGDMTKSKTERLGVDYKSIITIGDGSKEIKAAKLDKSYASGANIKTIVVDALNQVGLPVARNDMQDEQYNQGVTVSGSAKKIIDRFTGKQDLEWSIQDGEVQILNKDQDVGEEAILLTSNTGLLGSPFKREDNQVEFKSFIIPGITPGKKIKIESNDINGFFKVTKAKFIGSNHDGPWEILAECKELQNG